MFPDDLDIFILKEIFDSYVKNKDCNNWEIAKKYSLLKTGNEINTRLNSDIYRRIKQRLNSYCNHGIFFKSKTKNGKIIYNMDLDKITFAKHKFSDGLKYSIIIRI